MLHCMELHTDYAVHLSVPQLLGPVLTPSLSPALLPSPISPPPPSSSFPVQVAGLKTRDFDDVLSELMESFRTLKRSGS